MSGVNFNRISGECFSHNPFWFCGFFFVRHKIMFLLILDRFFSLLLSV